MISSRPPDSAALLTALASAVDAGAGLDTSSSEACANAGQPNKGTPATMKIETAVSSPEARTLILPFLRFCPADPCFFSFIRKSDLFNNDSSFYNKLYCKLSRSGKHV